MGERIGTIVRGGNISHEGNEPSPIDAKMQKTIEVVMSDFAGVRAGRANAGVLDKITVEYYGTETPHPPGGLHLHP